MPVAIPEIETARLRLRGHRAGDFTASAAMWGDAEVTRFIGGRPFTGEEVWSRLLRYIGHWEWVGYGTWVVEEKATGAFVGEIGFCDYRREIEPPLDVPEVGWVLARAMQRKGYGTEAIRAALVWGEAHLPLAPRTTCIIDPANGPSLRTAEKCGFREQRRAMYKGVELVVLGRS
jgi:RimJ/RimL family protein N-acetyltransferase